VAFGGDDLSGSVSFSRDGYRLDWASSLGPVCVSHGMPLTQETRAFREAVGLMRFHLRHAKSENDFLTRIRMDRTVSDDVRDIALRTGAVSFRSTQFATG